MSFDSLIFIIGSNWILHIISELMFADSKQKYEYPDFPVLECGDPEKYQVGTKEPWNLEQIILESRIGGFLVLSSENTTLNNSLCAYHIIPALFRDYFILLQNHLITITYKWLNH